jgi:hypothetical protein
LAPVATESGQDDAADDVLIMFDDLLEAGATPAEVVRLVILDPPWGWGDWDDEPTQVLALAAWSLEYEILTSTLRKWAIAAIDSGAPLGRWVLDETKPEHYLHRVAVLARFKAILQQGTAPREELESVTRPKEFSLWCLPFPRAG